MSVVPCSFSIAPPSARLRMRALAVNAPQKKHTVHKRFGIPNPYHYVNKRRAAASAPASTPDSITAEAPLTEKEAPLSPRCGPVAAVPERFVLWALSPLLAAEHIVIDDMAHVTLTGVSFQSRLFSMLLSGAGEADIHLPFHIERASCDRLRICPFSVDCEVSRLCLRLSSHGAKRSAAASAAAAAAAVPKLSRLIEEYDSSAHSRYQRGGGGGGGGSGKEGVPRDAAPPHRRGRWEVEGMTRWAALAVYPVRAVCAALLPRVHIESTSLHFTSLPQQTSRRLAGRPWTMQVSLAELLLLLLLIAFPPAPE